MVDQNGVNTINPLKPLSDVSNWKYSEMRMAILRALESAKYKYICSNSAYMNIVSIWTGWNKISYVDNTAWYDNRNFAMRN